MWKKTILAAAALCCSFLFCDNPAKEALKWRTAADIPINLTLKAEKTAAPYMIPGVDSVILDMADSSFTIYDQMFLFREKMDSVSADYNISIVNGYDFDLVFYALFAPFERGMWGIAGLPEVEDVYKFITDDPNKPGLGLLTDEYGNNYVNLLGRGGLEVYAGDTGSIDVKDTPLCGLLINAPSVAWRWLAKIRKSDYDGLGGADAEGTAGKIDARFRVRIKGVAKLDSLMVF